MTNGRAVGEQSIALLAH